MGELGAIFRSRIKWKLSRCRIPSTARIILSMDILSMDEIERWEKEALDQGLGNSFKPKKKKTKARRKAKRKK
ncbi:hypothetical protein Taitung45_05090 [Helicobacter pylori]